MPKKHEDGCCAQCERAKLLTGTDYCLCALHGPVDATHRCSRFIMDVFKLPIAPPPPFLQSESLE